MRKLILLIAIAALVLLSAAIMAAGPAKASRPTRHEVRACICHVAKKAHESRANRKALVWIAGRESTWNPKARNGSCLGLFQLGSGARCWARHHWKGWRWWRASDSTREAIHYCHARYGSPLKAKAFWLRHHSY